MTTLHDIATTLDQLESPAQIEAFLKEILTPNEVAEVIKRWDIFTLLSQGVPQREIAHQLHASLCKITRGSKELKKKHSIVRDILKK